MKATYLDIISVGISEYATCKVWIWEGESLPQTDVDQGVSGTLEVIHKLAQGYSSLGERKQINPLTQVNEGCPCCPHASFTWLFKFSVNWSSSHHLRDPAGWAGGLVSNLAKTNKQTNLGDSAGGWLKESEGRTPDGSHCSLVSKVAVPVMPATPDPC